MTLDERQKKAEQLLQKIEKECGFRFIAVLQAESLNTSVAQIRANVALQPIPEWVEPTPTLRATDG